VTQQKLAEEHRAEVEQRYRLLVEQLPGIVYIEDADPGATAYFVTDEASLLDALTTVVREVQSCNLVLNAELREDEACQSRVELDGNALACDAVNGFTLESPTVLALHGEACDRLLARPTPFVDVEFPCSALAAPPNACANDGDCGPAAPFCAPRGCVECLSDGHCSDGATCVGNACILYCESSADCSGATPYCDTARSECVGCLSNTNCGGGSTPVCDRAMSTCVGCAIDADCGSDTPRCALDSHTCVQCRTSADCGGDTQWCVDSVCVECRTGSFCPPCAGVPSQMPGCCRAYGACGCWSALDSTCIVL